jgi:N-acetylneuraminic acid mutarotase
MRVCTLFTLLSVLLTSANALAQYTWVSKTPLPSGMGRENDHVFVEGDHGYMGLGYNNDLWCYDSVTDSWTQKASFPGTFRQWAFGFYIDSAFYYGGGWGKKDFWKYNTNTDSWIQLDSITINTNGGVFFSVGGKGYVLTGTSLWQYDPLAQVWTQKNNFPGLARSWTTAIQINGKLYMAFGYDGNNVLKEVWEYEPLNDMWYQRNDAPDARFFAYGFSINNKGYFGGGRTQAYGSDFTDFYEYDPVADSWSIMPSPGGTSGAVAFGTSSGMGFYGFGNITCHIGPCDPFNFLKAWMPGTSTPRQELNRFEVLVYPNPAHKKLSVNLFSYDKDSQLSLFNSYGESIMTYPIKEKVLNLELPDLAPGAYHLKVTMKNSCVVRNLLIE